MAMPSGTGPAQAVREAVEPVVQAAGLFLEDVVIVPAGRRTAVRVVLDLAEDAVGSLDLDTLGEVSRDISAALDTVDPVRGEYVLEVSTPGTSRPLTQVRHFRRARTRLVRLVMRDGSVVTGRVVDADADGVDLDTEAGPRRVALADVARGAVEVELKRAEEVELDGEVATGDLDGLDDDGDLEDESDLDDDEGEGH